MEEYFIPNEDEGICTRTSGCNYEQATKLCELNGGHLATINNKAENSDVKFLIQEFDYPPEDWMFYIGLNDQVNVRL